MFKLKRIIIAKITISVIIILFAVNCSKDQNTFLPYVRVNLHISLVNQNHLNISGNSILFQYYGVKGVLVECVNPETNLYYAYDAGCPYEKDYSGIVEVKSAEILKSPPGMIYRSGFIGKCNKCGSEFNLMAGGQLVKGPATHDLQNYHVSTGFESLMVTN